MHESARAERRGARAAPLAGGAPALPQHYAARAQVRRRATLRGAAHRRRAAAGRGARARAAQRHRLGRAFRRSRAAARRSQPNLRYPSRAATSAPRQEIAAAALTTAASTLFTCRLFFNDCLI